MNQRTAIPPKVRSLVPMLASDMDNEALGACRAINRVLKGAGLSYHDLAEAIPVQSSDPTYRTACTNDDHVPTYNSTQWREAWRTRSARRAYTPLQEARHRDMARHCRDRDRGRLTKAEREFVWNIANLRSGLSIKQGDWLADICDRLEWEDRRACP